MKLVSLVCDTCLTDFTAQSKTAAIARRLSHAKGWLVRGKEDICASCLAKETKKPRPVRRMNPQSLRDQLVAAHWNVYRVSTTLGLSDRGLRLLMQREGLWPEYQQNVAPVWAKQWRTA